MYVCVVWMYACMYSMYIIDVYLGLDFRFGILTYFGTSFDILGPFSSHIYFIKVEGCKIWLHCYTEKIRFH